MIKFNLDPEKKKFLPLAIGLLLSVAAAFMVGNYISSRESNILQQAQESMMAYQKSQATIFVATKDIAPGTIITPDMVDKAMVSSTKIHPRAIRFFGDLAGKEAVAPIKRGSQIVADMLRGVSATKAGVGTTTFSSVIPEGKRAVTILPDNIAVLASILKPGDYVDVIGVVPVPGQKEVVTATLFQNILILGVGDEFIEVGREKKSTLSWFMGGTEEKTTKKPTTKPIVTLALSPQEASIITFVQQKGKLELVLRSPMDSTQPQIPPITTDMFFQFLTSRGLSMPQAGEGAAGPTMTGRQPKEKKRGIIIYRGVEKEEAE
jgi:pilus assembly protein CpaB